MKLLNLYKIKETIMEMLQKKNSKLTGIYEESIFNTVNLFHVVDNFSVDIMHDIYEDIGNYNIGVKEDIIQTL
jgi:hypothetical protein